jgi:hypothetical protein
MCDDLSKKRLSCLPDDENCIKTLDMELCRSGCKNCEEKENMTNVNADNNSNNYMYLLILFILLIVLYINRENIRKLF